MQEHIDKLQKKLQEAFPGHIVEVSGNQTPEDYSQWIGLKVDGKTLTARWSMKLVEDIRTYHGIDVEKEIVDALIYEIKEELRKN